MTLSFADRVFETSVTTGTGTINLAGAVAGFRSFISGVGTGKKVNYVIDDGVSWEVGIGTVTSGSPDTLSRTTILASSNSNALVNWGAGTRNVRLAPTARVAASKDENLNMIVGHGGLATGSANAQLIAVDPAPLGFTDGMILSWYSQGNVTGAMTVNPNSLGAKAVKWRGADLTSGAFSTGNLIIGIYRSSTGFVELITPPSNAFTIADNSISFIKLATSAIASVADLVSGALEKLVTASNLKSFLDTYIVTPWVSYTPTFTGLGTVTGIDARTRRVGQCLEYEIKFISGTPTATEARVTLGFNGTNNNVTAANDYPNLGASYGNVSGVCATTAGRNYNSYSLVEPSVGYLTFSAEDPGFGSLLKVIATTVFGSGSTYIARGSVRIQGW